MSETLRKDGWYYIRGGIGQYDAANDEWRVNGVPRRYPPADIGERIPSAEEIAAAYERDSAIHRAYAEQILMYQKEQAVYEKDLAKLRRERDALRKLLKPFAAFGKYIKENPRRGIEDEFYAWDGGSSCGKPEAGIRQSDLLRAAECLAALAASKPAPTEGREGA